MTSNPPTQSPVMDLDETSAYTRRSKNALRILRHRGRGPRSFLIEGQIHYYRVDVVDWVAERASLDKHFNAALDPVKRPTEVRTRKTVVAKSAA
ncbi:hypothetical protein ABZ916_39505 [Streptomyces sp. NPDC046853]|uniref:hypothetical protein n=1 Tax=Streptomyces sp. NPDC046853 TaxID=3154920 RepID=UPI0034087014